MASCLYKWEDGEYYPEDQLKKLFDSKENIQESSSANNETVKKVSEFLKRIGVETKSLDTTRYNGINGVAQLLQGIVQIADGKTNVALPEEAMHFAVEIVKQTNTSLYKQMMNKISSYQIYKDMLNDNSEGSYKNTYNDAIKLKKEAIGKVLAEYLIQQEEGSTEKPELLIQSKGWLEMIGDWFKALFTKAKLNPFQEVTKSVTDGSLTKAESPAKSIIDKIDTSKIEGGIYGSILKDLIASKDYNGAISLLENQLEDPATFDKITNTYLNGDTKLAEDILKGNFYQKNDFADQFIDQIKKINDDAGLRKVSEKETIDGEETDNAYVVKQGDKEVKIDRTTEYAKKENLKNSGGIDRFKNATEKEKAEWEAKAMSGTNGHFDFERMIIAATNEGVLKNSKDIKLDFEPATNRAVFNSLKTWLLGDKDHVGFLSTFPEGTKFITEKVIYNPKAGKTGRAGTVDLIVIPPKVEGQKQEIKIYDWKFMGFDLRSNYDIPKNKKQQHAIQLADYKNTIQKAILTPEQAKDTIVTAQTVPIHAVYKYVKEVPELKSVEIGNVSIKDEKSTYLLPVMAKDQSTGNPTIDSLIKKLESHYKKLYEGASTEQEKLLRREDAKQLSIAIRNLQVKLNFEPIAIEAKAFQTLVKSTLDKYKTVNDTSILNELRGLANSAATYSGIHEAFVSEFGEEGLDERSTKVLNYLKQVSKDADSLQKQILAKEASIIESSAQEVINRSVLTPELEAKGVLNTLTESNFVPIATVKYATKIVATAKSNMAPIVKNTTHTFMDLFFKAGGQSVFNKITKKGVMELVDKTSSEFREALTKAKDENNTQFILDNLDENKAKELIKEYVDANEATIKERKDIYYYSEDQEINETEALRHSRSFKSNIDIYSKGFTGHSSRLFNSILWRSLEVKDSIMSPEYRELARNQDQLNFYNFVVDFNVKAKQIGYLKNNKTFNFIPLITGSLLEQMNQPGADFKKFKGLLADNFTVMAHEDKEFSRDTTETGKEEKKLKTYYTRTDKDYEQLSKDLPKIYERYIESVLEYKVQQDLAPVMISLLELERNKPHLNKIHGQVEFEADKPKEYQGNPQNSAYLEEYIDDAIFNIKESNDTLFDTASNKLTKGTEEEKAKKAASAKKTIQQANKLIYMQALGMAPLVALPNFVGAYFQAYTNSGSYFKPGEYNKNWVRLIRDLVGKDKNSSNLLAAIDMFIPINEDVAKDARRESLYTKDKKAYFKTWSFREAVMSSNRLPERTHDLTNAITWLENTMLDPQGQLVNIRQYLRKDKEYQSRYDNPSSIKEAEAKFEEKVEELKASSIVNKIKFDEKGHPYIDGLAEKNNFGEYRTKIIEAGRKNTGQMSRDSKIAAKRNIIANSFMAFKNWIIPQVQLRAMDIQNNSLTDEWEYGRTRLFFKTIQHLGVKNILKIRDIKYATPEGIKIMKEILDQKKEDYYKKTGQELTITDADFYDMIRKELHSETKELRLLLGLSVLVLAALAGKPEDDNKSLYNMYLKATHKVYDEVGFYYDPLSAESVSKGSFLPALGLLSKVSQIVKSIGTETWAHATNNQELIDHTHPSKYIINMIPVANQIQNQVLPIWFPDEARAQAVKVSPLSRQQ